MSATLTQPATARPHAAAPLSLRGVGRTFPAPDGR